MEVQPKQVAAEEREEEKPPVKVEVPSIGEEIDPNFAVKSIDDIQDNVDVTVDDFDNIFIEANEM